jgi:glutamate racemase
MKIGIFDSGVGGLTVLKEMITLHPNVHYIYYGDTKNLPYGEKSKEELKILSDKIIKFLIFKNVDLIIIACGTISSNIYDEIKQKYSVKIMDVINPTVDYIKNNNLTDVGILGTNMTINSKVFEKKLKNVKSVACPKFVPAIESGNSVKEACLEYISKLGNVKNIVLGCTHYPIILNELRKYTDANFINMGKCVAESIEPLKEESPKIDLYFSKVSEDLKKNVKKIIGDIEIKEI